MADPRPYARTPTPPPPMPLNDSTLAAAHQRDRRERVNALTRADGYADVLVRYAEQPRDTLSTDALLQMVAKNYAFRVAEMVRLFQESDAASHQPGPGASYAMIGARECLRLLAEEDSKLTKVLQAFGKIVPKSLQLHGKAKDTLDALRDLKRAADQGAAAVKRPRGRPRKLLTAPIPPVDKAEPYTGPKRGRGRPRKHPIIPVDQVEPLEPST